MRQWVRFRRLSGVMLALRMLSLIAFCGCSRAPVRSYIEGPFPQKLSEWRLFVSTEPILKPNKTVVPYDLNTPLFSDYASKYRFVWMPPGSSAEYRQDATFEFPVGTVLAKTFAFPVDGQRSEKLIETRLLVRAKNGWVGLPYVWNEQQDEATLQMVPDPVAVKYTDRSGRRHDFTYVIPNANECHECHDNNKVMLPIGPKARNLNKDYKYEEEEENQLLHWVRIGYLQGLPPPEVRPKVARWDEPSSGTVEQRARAYLDNNCAHCHQPRGQAGYTGVDFRITQSGVAQLGLCKSPNSAGQVGGLRYDLVPGRPDQSIIIYRLESTAPKVSMPPLSRDVVHEEGVKLMREWIASLGETRGSAIKAPDLCAGTAQISVLH